MIKNVSKNKMLFSVVFISILQASCSSFKMQIVSVSCDNFIKNDTIWTKKDSLVWIGYYFYGRGGTSRLFIANKSDKPVFFDKKNSFLAGDNFKKDFWSDVSQVNGEVTIKQYRSINLQTQNPINGTVTKTDRIDMIAPNSILVFDPQIILKNTLFDLKKYSYKTDSVKANWTSNPIKKTAIKSVNFTEDNSPSAFRYFLTFAKTEDFKDPHYFDFNFWVSDIMEMDARQGTKSDDPRPYSFDSFNVDQRTAMDKFHPYKKSWRYYLSEVKYAD